MGSAWHLKLELYDTCMYITKCYLKTHHLMTWVGRSSLKIIIFQVTWNICDMMSPSCLPGCCFPLQSSNYQYIFWSRRLPFISWPLPYWDCRTQHPLMSFHVLGYSGSAFFLLTWNLNGILEQSWLWWWKVILHIKGGESMMNPNLNYFFFNFFFPICLLLCLFAITH